MGKPGPVSKSNKHSLAKESASQRRRQRRRQRRSWHIFPQPAWLADLGVLFFMLGNCCSSADLASLEKFLRRGQERNIRFGARWDYFLVLSKGIAPFHLLSLTIFHIHLLSLTIFHILGDVARDRQQKCASCRATCRATCRTSAAFGLKHKGAAAFTIPPWLLDCNRLQWPMPRKAHWRNQVSSDAWRA